MRNLKKWLYSCFIFTLICGACQRKVVITPNLEPTDRLIAIEEELQRISQSSLPDFAPDLFKAMNKEAGALRGQLDRLGRMMGVTFGYSVSSNFQTSQSWTMAITILK